MRRQPNGPEFDVRAALFALLGKDLTQINGLGPYLALKLIAECGDDLSAWPSAKHFTSWLCLAPSNKISGGKVLSSRTRRSASRAAALLRLAAVTIGRTDTALGAFYRRLSARIGKVKAGHRRRWLEDKAEGLGAPMQVVDDPRTITDLVGGRARVDVVHPFLRKAWWKFTCFCGSKESSLIAASLRWDQHCLW